MFLLLAISCIMLPNSASQQSIVGYVTPIGEEMEAWWVPSP